MLGRVVARRDLIGLLITRLRLRADRIRHPEIAGEHIAQPVFIVGLPRSGSTLLHHLLGQDPLTRVPQAWEVMYPSPPPARATYDTDPRIAQATRQLRWIDWLAPDFKTIHPVGARLPLECIALMSASFRSTRFQAMYNVPSYEAWLEQGDMRPGYAFHRSVLQQLQWRVPGARWMLKAPSHLFAIDALLHTYPDARIVQTHRDPVTVIGSLASMSATLQGAFTDRLQPDAIGREILRWTRGLERSMQLRHGGPLPADRFVDVHYHELTRDPMKVVRRIYTQFAMPFSRDRRDGNGAIPRRQSEGQARPSPLHARALRVRHRGPGPPLQGLQRVLRSAAGVGHVLTSVHLLIFEIGSRPALTTDRLLLECFPMTRQQTDGTEPVGGP